MIDLFLNLDKHLHDVILHYGPWTYGILFLVIFCETGLVITPFLPGDSLLFAAGMFANPEKGAFNVFLLVGLLAAASVLGDNTNFWIGRALGRRLFSKEDSRFFKRSYLVKTREFYDRHGTKTVIIGRFVPIVRTFAPFVAGMDAMEYDRFLPASLIGALTWVGLCTASGYFFGRIPWVQQNFSIAIMGVIALSLVGIFVEFVRSHRRKRAERAKSES
ncbi:MAG TPA: DedA family protein [Fimbriimonadaceae bacterium]|nr:DedA family protein [Fimbriimonadaceae bacterium]